MRRDIEAVLALHTPYMSIPIDIVEGVPWEPGASSYPATLDEKAAGMRWWCDECRCDAPCQTYTLLTTRPQTMLEAFEALASASKEAARSMGFLSLAFERMVLRLSEDAQHREQNRLHSEFPLLYGKPQ